MLYISEGGSLSCVRLYIILEGGGAERDKSFHSILMATFTTYAKKLLSQMLITFLYVIRDEQASIIPKDCQTSLQAENWFKLFAYGTQRMFSLH